MPVYGSLQAAGADLHANVRATTLQSGDSITVEPGARKLVKTGVALELPPGTWAEVRGRSGLALKNGIAILAGVIDSDYRGDIGVMVHNTSDTPFTINQGDRIGQLIIETFVRGHFVEKAELRDTERGEKGFGSTGVAA